MEGLLNLERQTTIKREHFAVDVEELPKNLIISAEMPGLKLGSLELNVAEDERVLTISGEKDITLKRTKHVRFTHSIHSSLHAYTLLT